MAKADLEALRAEFGGAILETSDFRGDETALISPERVHDALAYLKRARGYDMCVDVCGVDYPERRDRLEVVWHLHSLKDKKRIRVKARVPAEEGKNVLPTSTDIWAGADWFERECWDLVGVRFAGHPNLQRILTYEGFEGHPLRRDYPIDRRQPRKQTNPGIPQASK